jgi:hypothetical protein
VTLAAWTGRWRGRRGLDVDAGSRVGASPRVRTPYLALVSALPKPRVTPTSPSALDADAVLDELGHTALHRAGAMARLQIVHALLAAGADVHRGNFAAATSGKSILHHIVVLAGVKGRAVSARYFMDVIFCWITQH